MSGADSYSQLCIAAKHEEKRLNELARRQHYLKDVGKEEAEGRPPQNPNTKTEKRGETRGEPRQSYACCDTDHLARSCKKRKTKSTGHTRRNAGANMVKTRENPLNSLHPDSGDSPSDIKAVKGSKLREVLVDVQGVPPAGIIDSGADITIMGAELFKKVASVA